MDPNSYTPEELTDPREVTPRQVLGMPVAVSLAVPKDEIQQRLALQMVNEAARALEEEVLRSPRDGDIGAIFAASPGATMAGFVAAFAVGLGALALLRAVVARRKLWVFGAYKVVLGLTCLGFAIGGRS